MALAHTRPVPGETIPAYPGGLPVLIEEITGHPHEGKVRGKYDVGSLRAEQAVVADPRTGERMNGQSNRANLNTFFFQAGRAEPQTWIKVLGGIGHTHPPLMVILALVEYLLHLCHSMLIEPICQLHDLLTSHLIKGKKGDPLYDCPITQDSNCYWILQGWVSNLIPSFFKDSL